MPTRDAAPVGAPCWIDVFSSDTARAAEFYSQLFGWTAEDQGEEYGGYILLLKDGIQVAGMMGNAADSGMPDFWTVYLATDDADAVAAATTARGGTVYAPPMDVMDLGRMAVFGDVGGATIGAWQPGTHKGFGVWNEPGAPAWFELHTNAYDESVAFYRDVFGWDTHAMSVDPSFRYTTLGEGEGQLSGIMDATNFLPEGVPPYWVVYFAVEDTDAALDRVVELGGSVLEKAEDTPYGRMGTVADPTGATFKVSGPNKA